MGKELPQETPLETQRSCLDWVIGQNVEEDIAEQHEQARLVMADLEDIMYSAVCRVISDMFRE